MMCPSFCAGRPPSLYPGSTATWRSFRGRLFSATSNSGRSVFIFGVLNFVRQVVADRIRQYEIAVGQTLHQRRCAQTVRAVVGEVGLADRIQAGDRGHQVVIQPDTAHRIVHGRIDRHRFFVRIDVGDLFVHLEQVAVTFADRLFAEAVDCGRKVEEYGQAGLVDPEAGVATLFGGARRHVARHEIPEGRVTAFEVVVAVFFRDLRRFQFLRADLFDVLFFFGT